MHQDACSGNVVQASRTLHFPVRMRCPNGVPIRVSTPSILNPIPTLLKCSVDADEIPVITLAQNLNLCSLRFGLVSDLLLISQLILSLPTGVKEVVILQQQAGDGPIGEFKDDFCQQWTSIDQHLSHTKFEHLRKVVVNVTGLSSAAKLFRVEQLLPKLLARGTLDTKQRRVSLSRNTYHSKRGPNDIYSSATGRDLYIEDLFRTL